MFVVDQAPIGRISDQSRRIDGDCLIELQARQKSLPLESGGSGDSSFATKMV
jgi:hypothetical protein